MCRRIPSGIGMTMLKDLKVSYIGSPAVCVGKTAVIQVCCNHFRAGSL